jgi:hypothetical protein
MDKLDGIMMVELMLMTFFSLITMCDRNYEIYWCFGCVLVTGLV